MKASERGGGDAAEPALGDNQLDKPSSGGVSRQARRRAGIRVGGFEGRGWVEGGAARWFAVRLRVVGWGEDEDDGARQRLRVRGRRGGAARLAVRLRLVGAGRGRGLEGEGAQEVDQGRVLLEYMIGHPLTSFFFQCVDDIH